MTNKLKFFYNFAIPIVVLIIGSFSGSWLLIKYNQPQLILYTDEYYQKVNDISIGEFYVINEGRGQDENVSLSIDKEIPISDITVAYTNSPYDIKIKNGYTYINIEKINPNEGIEVVFKAKTSDATFTIEDFSSKSGNILRRNWINHWWNLTPLQVVLVIFLVTVGFGAGFSAGLWKNDLIKKNGQIK